MNKPVTDQSEKLYISSHVNRSASGSFENWAIWRNRLPETLVVDELHDNRGNSLHDCTLFTSVQGEQRAYHLTEEQCSAFLNSAIAPLIREADVGAGKNIEIPLKPKTLKGPLEQELHELEMQKTPYTVIAMKANPQKRR